MLPFVLSLALILFSQNQIIFPNLSGPQLIDSVTANYKTSTVYSYDDARDTLFAKIYMHEDSLKGVYSGYTIYLDPTQDPTTWAFNNGINTEHSWPQSKGAVGQAKSDMHHLYPSRSNVNSSRGNDPFAESPDNQTSKWWRNNYFLTTIPTQYIDEFSEKNNSANTFEPREDHKGNVARAMFYFYTMYKQEADSLDPQFFPMQKDILYQWHLIDPVDSLELVRNNLIADYQGGFPNPFILDSTLFRRAYFETTKINTNRKNINISGDLVLYQNHPNPFNSSTTIKFVVNNPGGMTLRIFDVTGKNIKTIQLGYKGKGIHAFIFDGIPLSSGIYYYKIKHYVKKMIILN